MNTTNNHLEYRNKMRICKWMETENANDWGDWKYAAYCNALRNEEQTEPSTAPLVSSATWLWACADLMIRFAENKVFFSQCMVLMAGSLYHPFGGEVESNHGKSRSALGITIKGNHWGLFTVSIGPILHCSATFWVIVGLKKKKERDRETEAWTIDKSLKWQEIISISGKTNKRNEV